MGLPRGARSRLQSSRRFYTEIASTPKSKNLDSPSFIEDRSPLPNSPSPISFICTQDGSHKENDVIWNYYSPKSKGKITKNLMDTPVRRPLEITPIDSSPISRIPLKKKISRQTHLKKGFLKGFIEEFSALNKHVQELVCVNLQKISEENSTLSQGFDDSRLNNNVDSKTNYQSDVIPLKTHINEKILKCDSEGLESDDSMNEYLIKASQLVEEKIDECNKPINKIFNNNKDEPELISQKENKSSCHKKSELNVNDSFDNLLSNINDSYIEVITQVHNEDKILKPVENFGQSAPSNPSERKDFKDMSWNSIKNFTSLFTESILYESKSKFSRHKSMPITNHVIPREKKSYQFIRHNSMPSSEESSNPQIVCSEEEIKRKRQAAKEKLFKKQCFPPLNITTTSYDNSHFNINKNVVSNDTNISNSLKDNKFYKNIFKRNTIKFKNNNMNSEIDNHSTDKTKNNLEKNKFMVNEIERKKKEAQYRLRKHFFRK